MGNKIIYAFLPVFILLNQKKNGFFDKVKMGIYFMPQRS